MEICGWKEQSSPTPTFMSPSMGAHLVFVSLSEDSEDSMRMSPLEGGTASMLQLQVHQVHQTGNYWTSLKMSEALLSTRCCSLLQRNGS